jgi:hypothetical protein
MTSLRQLEANRRNALHSTGPTSEDGKRQSRLNAVRHGLTAETVISSLEDADDYKAFEATIIADYDPTTAVERELVLRLASLLWRLRRATGIETDLLNIHSRNGSPSPTGMRDLPLHPAATEPSTCRIDAGLLDQQPDATPDAEDLKAHQTRRLTYSFLRLPNLDSGVLERLSRYEAALWRQTVQILFALMPAKPRYPHRRKL